MSKPFSLTDQHIADYYHHGHTTLRAIVPPALIEELRIAGDELLDFTVKLRGKPYPRSPALAKIADKLSLRARQAFRDYCELPELVTAVHRLLGPDHSIDFEHDQIQGFFTHPYKPNCEDWHRSIEEGYNGVTEPGTCAEFRNLKQDPGFFVQAHCALYTDTSLWYVPGSASRRINTKGELAAAGTPHDGNEGRGKLLNAELEGLTYAEQERLCLDYCSGMPGAVNLVLDPGDFCIYRPLGWYTCFYAPHRKRLTLIHLVGTAASRAWNEAFNERRNGQNAVPAP